MFLEEQISEGSTGGRCLDSADFFLEAARVDWLSTGQGQEAKARENRSLSLSV